MEKKTFEYQIVVSQGSASKQRGEVGLFKVGRLKY